MIDIFFEQNPPKKRGTNDGLENGGDEKGQIFGLKNGFLQEKSRSERVNLGCCEPPGESILFFRFRLVVYLIAV
jgi:hypothetical protein